jgi:hypothetical protein
MPNVFKEAAGSVENSPALTRLEGAARSPEGARSWMMRLRWVIPPMLRGLR